MNKPVITARECGMMLTTGAQGVGKTYQNMYIIYNYVQDKIKTGVKGRKALIFDTNGEYTKSQFEANGINDFNPRPIAVRDIADWCQSDVVECRRIDAKNVSISQKKAILEHLCKVCVNCLLVVEDINTYVLALTHMEEVVGGLVNLRHKGTDVLISYQTLRAVEPRLWGNSRWFRMHFQADNVNDIKGKVNNPTLMKIAQYIVNNRYHAEDERFFVYIYNNKNKIEGDYTKDEFYFACKQYLSANKKYIKEYMDMYDCDRTTAIQKQADQYFKQFYGNAA